MVQLGKDKLERKDLLRDLLRDHWAKTNWKGTQRKDNENQVEITWYNWEKRNGKEKERKDNEDLFKRSLGTTGQRQMGKKRNDKTMKTI